MKGADFVAEFRRVMNDEAQGQLWTDEEIIRYLNSAVEEACERAQLIEDRSSSQCCQLNLTPGQATYRLHPSVLHIKRMAFNGRPLLDTSEEELDTAEPGWESRTGQPRAFFRVGVRDVRIVPIPQAVAVLNMTVYRLPLKPVPEDTFDGATIELPDIYHLRLMAWIYRCALLKNDSEVINPVKAAQFEAQFEQSFGKRPDANVQRKRRDKRPPVVRCTW